MPHAKQLCAIAAALVIGLSGRAIAQAGTHPELAPAQPAKAYQAASTRAMGALLAKIFHDTDWRLDPNKPAERVLYYRSLLDDPARKLTFADAAVVRRQLAVEQLSAGESEAAVETLEALRRDFIAARIVPPPALDRGLHEQLGVAYLRLGEQQNCAAMPVAGSKACVFPLRASAVHKLPRGAEGAVREFSANLTANPTDAEARWLLNVAEMQLGRYPEAVPKAWLIPAGRFASEAALPDFPDDAMLAGLDVTGHAGGAVMEDFDGDGLLDIMVTSSGPLDPMHLFHNNGDGTFSDISAQAGLTGETGGLNLVVTDYNNDGHPDVLVLRGGWWGPQGCYPMSLLRNNGDGTFDDVTVAAGLLSLHPTQTAAWADFDNDGWLDLLVPHESTPDDPHPTQLFHNNRDGTFTDVSRAVHLDRAILPMGANFGDLDNDGFLDIYLGTGDSTWPALLPNRMFRNDGGRGFQDVTTAGGFGHLQKGHGVAFGDLFGTGHEDIFEEMGGAQPGDTYMSALYRNPGNTNHFITLELEGVQTNRAAFGARLDLTVRDPAISKPRHIVRTVGYGSSFGGNPLRQHIGLGAATEVERLEVFWPTSRRTQHFDHIVADQQLHLREGDAALVPLPSRQQSVKADAK